MEGLSEYASIGYLFIYETLNKMCLTPTAKGLVVGMRLSVMFIIINYVHPKLHIFNIIYILSLVSEIDV